MSVNVNCLTPTIAENLGRLGSDLKMGLPCLVSSKAGRAIVIAVEPITQVRLDKLRSLFGSPELILTENRGRTVMILDTDGSVVNGPLQISAPPDVKVEWFRRLADTAYDGKNGKMDPMPKRSLGDEAIARLVIKLVKSAELLPAAILFPIPLDMELPADLHLTQIDANAALMHLEQLPELSCVASAGLPLQAHKAGRLNVFRDPNGTSEHFALEVGNPDRTLPILCRLHSACFTGDVLGSLKCDCGSQLHSALDQMGAEGAGILLYLNQEGRGIGLANKLRAYDLQAQGFDTVEANHRLGFDDDERDFRIASAILRTLGVQTVKLLTNNPAKVKILHEHGVTVSERIPLRVGENAHNSGYLAAKMLKSGHAL